MVLVFVPIKYVYPSRTEPMWQLTFVLTGLWFVAYAAIVAGLPDPNELVVTASVVLPRLLHGTEPLADVAVPAPGRARRGRGPRLSPAPLRVCSRSDPEEQTAG